MIPQDLTTKVGNSIVVENSSIQLRTAPGQYDEALKNNEILYSNKGTIEV